MTSQTIDIRGAYRSSTALAWTRIDMLLALYGATTAALEEGIKVLAEGDETEKRAIRFRVQRLLLGLIDGLDLEQGDVPKNVLRLCLHVWDQVQTDDVEMWLSGLEVIQTLQRGFEAVADDARRKEDEGVIPPLAFAAG